MSKVKGTENKPNTYWVTQVDAFGNIVGKTVEFVCKKKELEENIYKFWKLGPIIMGNNPDIKTVKKAIEEISVDKEGVIPGRFLVTACIGLTGDLDMYWVADDVMAFIGGGTSGVKKNGNGFKLFCAPGEIIKVS